MSNPNGEVRLLPRKLRFEECCKNHALNKETTAKDGCKKFTANKREGVSQLLCDACDCHKSFHKRKVVKDRSASAEVVFHGKCQKNHKLRPDYYKPLLDGCCQFIASQGEPGSRDILICDGCGCHRNFHQKQEDDEGEDQPVVAADDSIMNDSEEDSDDQVTC